MPTKKKKTPSKKKADVLRIRTKTPQGRIVYPHLVTPNEKGKYPSGKFEITFMISKDIWKEEGKALREAVLKVGRAYYKDDALKLSDFANPFQDGDDKESSLFHDHIVMHPKNKQQPMIVDFQKKELSEDAIKAIKSGDYARLAVTVAPYEQQGGGVTLYLDVLQFLSKGAAIGGGVGAALELLDEIDAEDLDDDESEDDEDTESDDESEDDDDEEDIRI